MSVSVEIRQKGLFKKKITMKEIIELSDLSYGICDENYRLIENGQAQHTLLYDNKHLARGIDVMIENTNVFLMLNLPTSIEEIKLFYSLIEKICKKLKTNEFYRDEELVNIKKIEQCIHFDKEASIIALEDIKKKIEEKAYKHLEIFGIINPLSIGKKEIDKIGNSIDNLGDFLDKKQQLDVYYAVPRVYKKEDKMFGVYTIPQNIDSVIPTKPYIVLNQIEGVEAWYIMLDKDFIIAVSLTQIPIQTKRRLYRSVVAL